MYKIQEVDMTFDELNRIFGVRLECLTKCGSVYCVWGFSTYAQAESYCKRLHSEVLTHEQRGRNVRPFQYTDYRKSLAFTKHVEETGKVHVFVQTKAFTGKIRELREDPNIERKFYHRD